VISTDIFRANDQARQLAYMKDQIAAINLNDFSLIRTTPETFRDALTTLRDELGRIGQTYRMGAAEQQQLTEAAYARANAIVDEAFKNASKAKQRLEARAQAALAPDTQSDTSAAILEEQRQVRAWARAQRLLEVQSVAEVASAFGAAGDVSGLRALRTELPAWIAQRWKDRGNTEVQVKQAMEQLDMAEWPLLTDAQRQARALQADLARGWPRLEEGRQQAYMLFRLPDRRSASIPGWEASVSYFVSLVPRLGV